MASKKGPFVCSICTHATIKHYDFLRQPLSAKEQARYKAYNSHKPRTNPRAKRTYKSVEFIDSSMDTDGSDTSPFGTPTKKSKSLSSSESTPLL